MFCVYVRAQATTCTNFPDMQLCASLLCVSFGGAWWCAHLCGEEISGVKLLRRPFFLGITAY